MIYSISSSYRALTVLSQSAQFGPLDATHGRYAAYLDISCSMTSMLLPRVSGTLTLAYQQPRRATEPNRVHTAARPMSSTPRANSWQTTCSRQNQGGG